MRSGWCTLAGIMKEVNSRPGTFDEWRKHEGGCLLSRILWGYGYTEHNSCRLCCRDDRCLYEFYRLTNDRSSPAIAVSLLGVTPLIYFSLSTGPPTFWIQTPAGFSANSLSTSFRAGLRLVMLAILTVRVMTLGVQFCLVQYRWAVPLPGSRHAPCLVRRRAVLVQPHA